MLLEEESLFHRYRSLNEIKNILRACLTKLYTHDRFLFERKNGNGVREQCLVFRFAHYLQNMMDEFYVDCEYNSAFQLQDDGSYIEIPCKTTTDSNNEEHCRYPDIIVQTRELRVGNDFICLEIKKHNNTDRVSHDKDVAVLTELTSNYGYRYGFHLILGKDLMSSKWTIYAQNPPRTSRVIIQDQLVFADD